MCSSLLILPKEPEMSQMQPCPLGPLIRRRSRAGISLVSCLLLLCSSCFYGSIGDYPLSFFKGFNCVIFNYAYVSVQVRPGACGSQRPQVPLELVIQAVVSCLHGCCKPPSGPLNGQCMLFSTEPSLQRDPHPTGLSLWELGEVRHSSSLIHSMDS